MVHDFGTCRICQHILKERDTIGKTTICPNCGFYSTAQSKSWLKRVLAISAFVGLGLTGWNLYERYTFASPKKIFAGVETASEVNALMRQCPPIV